MTDTKFTKKKKKEKNLEKKGNRHRNNKIYLSSTQQWFHSASLVSLHGNETVIL